MVAIAVIVAVIVAVAAIATADVVTISTATVIATITHIIITITRPIPSRAHRRIDVKHQPFQRRRWKRNCAKCRVMRKRKNG